MVLVSDNHGLKPSKQALNESALKFKLNVEQEINKTPKDSTAGARYECIYKNFLRDIRQFYSEKFNIYIANI